MACPYLFIHHLVVFIIYILFIVFICIYFINLKSHVPFIISSLIIPTLIYVYYFNLCSHWTYLYRRDMLYGPTMVDIISLYSSLLPLIRLVSLVTHSTSLPNRSYMHCLFPSHWVPPSSWITFIYEEGRLVTMDGGGLGTKIMWVRRGKDKRGEWVREIEIRDY